MVGINPAPKYFVTGHERFRFVGVGCLVVVIVAVIVVVWRVLFCWGCGNEAGKTSGALWISDARGFSTAMRSLRSEEMFADWFGNL